jgi:hypothetical protein
MRKAMMTRAERPYREGKRLRQNKDTRNGGPRSRRVEMALVDGEDKAATPARLAPSARINGLAVFWLLIHIMVRGGLPRALTVQEMVRAVDFPRRARREAHAAVQHGIPVHPAPSEVDARAMADTRVAEIEGWWATRARFHQGRLDRLGAPARQKPFAGIVANCDRDVAAAQQSFTDRYRECERDAQEAELFRDGLAFELGERAPRMFKQPLVLAAGVSISMVVEGFLGAPFFEKLTSFGLIGGGAMAVMFALPLVVLTFIGCGVLPRLASRTMNILRMLAVGVMAMTGAYLLWLAHYRHLLASNKAATLLDAWHSLVTAPGAFLATNEAAVLVVLNVGVMGWVGIKSPALFEQIWGLAMASRFVDEKREEADAEAEEYRDTTLPCLQQEAEEKFAAVLKTAQAPLAASIGIAAKAIADRERATAEQRKTEEAFVQFRLRLHVELAQQGAPGLGAAVAAGTTPGTSVPQTRVGGDPFLLKAELHQRDADLVDAAETGEGDIRAIVNCAVRALPGLRSKIKAEVAAELATPPLRKKRG